MSKNYEEVIVEYLSTIASNQIRLLDKLSEISEQNKKLIELTTDHNLHLGVPRVAWKEEAIRNRGLPKTNVVYDPDYGNKR